jgi:hypothetical protein
MRRVNGARRSTIRLGSDDRLVYFLIRGTDFTDTLATPHSTTSMRERVQEAQAIRSSNRPGLTRSTRSEKLKQSNQGERRDTLANAYRKYICFIGARDRFGRWSRFLRG